MAVRVRYLVSYDICDPKRLRRVAKICEGHGFRIQFSVFECPLDGVALVKLKAALAREMNENEDQVLFVSLGPEHGERSIQIEALGLPYEQHTRVTVI
jgi:CRISPR-associated protein Cas2